MKFAALIAVTSVLVIGAGCGDDETTGSGGTGGSATSTTSTSGTGGTATSTTSTGGSTGTASAAGGAGGGPSSAADQFCTKYEQICGFANPAYFDDRDDCLDDYDSKFDAARRTCVEDNLGLADGDAAMYCPAATGDGACAI